MTDILLIITDNTNDDVSLVVGGKYIYIYIYLNINIDWFI